MFPTPLLIHKNFLPEEYFNQVKNLVENADYDGNTNLQYKVQASVSKNILKHLPIIKEEIIETFKEYARNILGIDSTIDFVIGSSWGTMTKPKEDSQPHTHANYYYSGCFYISENPSPIEFHLGPWIYNHHERFLFNYTQINQYNSNKITYHPEKNEIIYFPSYVKHQITENTSNENRYSLAFNIFPDGIYGDYDSKIHLKVIDDLD